ncbi:MAG: transporter substrate-binding domain-containing protein, partial [Clostridia bacterium]|nr:transporter substrate-binding domain-containing protein [Clostridia bacterium]
MASCVLFACSGESVRHVTLDEHEVVMTENSTYVLNADVRTGTSTSYTGLVVWESSDEDVATVSSGIVTAVAPGHTTITVTAKGTDVSDSCAVTVTTTERLSVGVKDDVKNFGYRNPNTREYEGMEVDLAKKIATELLYAGVDFTTVTSADRIQKLDDGDVDFVIATFSITDERREQVNFSSPYYTDYVQILVR